MERANRFGNVPRVVGEGRETVDGILAGGLSNFAKCPMITQVFNVASIMPLTDQSDYIVQHSRTIFQSALTKNDLVNAATGW